MSWHLGPGAWLPRHCLLFRSAARHALLRDLRRCDRWLARRLVGALDCAQHWQSACVPGWRNQGLSGATDALMRLDLLMPVNRRARCARSLGSQTADSCQSNGNTLTGQVHRLLMQCRILLPFSMKLIGFWLLIVLAVLVPATASVATSMFCPTISVAKVKAPGQVAQTKNLGKHAALSGVHARPAGARAPGKKAVAADTHGQTKHCCDASPCSHCTSCGSCVSMATELALGAADHPLVELVLPDPGGPRAEFLLSGQERPPRAS